MPDQNSQQHTAVKLKFSLAEKILLGLGYYALVITGMYGTYLESIVWGVVYTVFVIFGFSILLGYCVCSYCPYIFPEYSDCLFPPFGRVVRKLYKFQPGPISILDKTGFFVMMIGVVLIPQYCLLKNHTLLIIFWLFCLPTYAGLILYECKRCQHFNCIFNRAERH